MEIFFNFLLDFTRAFGHFGVLVLMTVESSFIPFPSEIVVPPAAFLAQQGELNIFLVVGLAVLGSLLGATINYYLAKYLGRPVVYKILERRFFRFLLLDGPKVRKAEEFFLKYGELATFVGRLLPGIRQLISLPAGFAQMPFWRFLLWTFLGSGIWVMILAFQGYLIGEYQEFFAEYVDEIVFGLSAFIVFAYLLFRFWRGRTKGL